MTHQDRPPLIILRRKQVEARTGLSRSGIYDRLNSRSPQHDPSFPKPVRLGARSVGWIEAECEQWLTWQIEASRKVAV